ncbi:MAG: ABC transporter substrate-binding protein [Planctomycetaceae bacterium]|nr:ABC transporter substrate-binding protein [Planctomycetaceae bacterium]
MRLHLIGGALLALVASCGGGETAEQGTGSSKTMVVGFAQLGAESNWRTAETRSVQDEAQRRGVELKFADAQGQQENQIRALKGFVGMNVGAILLAPKTETGWDNVLADVRKKNIPVVLLDRGVKVADESLYTTLIASDFVEEGRKAATWLVGATGGKCRLVELQGTVGSAPAIDRQKGFLEVLAQHPGMEVILSQTAEFGLAKGKEVMEAFLKAKPKEIQAVYAHNDDMALGAIQALEAAGLKPGVDVLVVSIDGGKPAFEAMAAGKLNCVVECSPLLGPLAFDALERLQRGETLPKRIVVEDRVFTAAEAAAELPNRKY